MARVLMKRLNLGCGNDIKIGFDNIDFIDLPGVNIVHDLNSYPYPIANDEYDEIICHHILEHLNDIVKPLEELWRISKPGARIKIDVPSFPGIGAIVDPTHKQYYTFGTFDYFTENHLFSYYSKAKFRIVKRTISFSYSLPPLSWFNSLLTKIVNSHFKLQKAYFYNLSFIYPAQLLEVELETIKHDDQQGLDVE